MRCRVLINIAIFILLISKYSTAQKVLYSPFIDDEFNVIGKTGNYYWIEKKEIRRFGKHHGDVEAEIFEIYDTRMNLVNIVDPSIVRDSILKEYFIANRNSLDQLILVSDHKKTSLFITRYAPEGAIITGNKILMDLPFSEDGNSFLLTRSEDKSKILLLCFESSST